MAQSAARALAVIAAFVVAAIISPAAQEKVSFAPLLDAFLHGDFSARQMPPLESPQNGRTIDPQPRLSRDAALWIAAGPSHERDRRRLLAASVALYLSNTLGPRDWSKAYSLLEWGCKLIRRNAQPSEAERLWHWAAIALTEASGNGSDAEAHAGHASSRFPNEPRFVLARAVALEMQSWPDERHRSPRDRDARLADRVVERFRTAAKHADVRAEANIRLGFFMLRHGFAGAALDHFRRAGEPSEPYLRYLLALFEGRAHEREEHMEDAIAAYRRAVAAAPTGQTAELALAAALVRSGKQPEGIEVVRRTLRPATDVNDPWLSYGQGDLRLWPGIARALEASLR